MVANIGTICAEFAGIAVGFELFGISRYASVSAVATDTAAQITLAHCFPGRRWNWTDPRWRHGDSARRATPYHPDQKT